MAIHIVVDGYNLVRQLASLRSINTLDLQRSREGLIERLSQYRKVKRYPITVVFDGWMTENLYEVREKEKGITVIFSRSGEKADEVIKRIAAKWQQRIVVVTSDHEVANFCKRYGATVVSSQEFEIKMDTTLHPQIESIGELGQYSRRIGTKKKGPSKKLPKQERRNRIRIKKL